MHQKARAIPRKAKSQSSAANGFKIYDITFNDVIGYGKHKKMIKGWVELPIRRPDRFTLMRMPKSTGIILYGPPGTGKTFLAKGLSGELQIPMKDVYISEMIQKHIGESEKAIKKAFDDAKHCQPSILFFDEFDALGASRENANEVTSSELKNMVNELLKQLGEIHDNREEKVFVIGATNLPWMLDDAIKRSGRMEHHMFLGPPGFWDRIALFKYYMRLEGSGYQIKANLMLLALATIRYSPADIEKVCSAVKRRIIDSEKKVITTRDFQRVLKDKNDGVSSLDDWVLKARETYIKKTKTRVEKTGFMGMRKNKVKTEEQGKMTEGELKIYKPLINYIKRTMRWWTMSNVIRRMAKGI